MKIHLPIQTNLAANEVGTRETRLGSVTGFSGTLSDLSQQSSCDGPRDRERCFSQASLCNAACALSRLGLVADGAVINHGPSGCAVTAMGLANIKHQLADAIGADVSRSAFVSTDMNESDTVFGSTETLRSVARETFRRYQPRALFLGASCVSGVIGEDLDSIAAELEAELGVPVAPVHCEGFKSKIWATGFDNADHALLQHVVQPATRRTNVINVINFFGSARREITALFAELGVEPLFVLASNSVEELSRLSEARATISTCGTLGSYLGNGLQELFGVPYVRSLQPLGIAGYESWLGALGEELGKQDEVAAILERERAEYLPRIEAVTAKLKGLRAVIGMGPGFTFNTARVLQEFGIEVVHAAAWHFDKQYDDGHRPFGFETLGATSPHDFSVSVSDLQNHELLNILNRTKPDVYFSRHSGSTVWAMKLGIPALCLVDEYAVFGYRGVLNFANWILDAVTNRSFTDNLSKRVKLPYHSWWFDQSFDHFYDNEPSAIDLLDADDALDPEGVLDHA